MSRSAAWAAVGLAAERELGLVHWPVSSASFSLNVGICPRMPEGADAGAGLGQVGLGAAPGGAAVPSLRCSRTGPNTSGAVEFRQTGDDAGSEGP